MQQSWRVEHRRRNRQKRRQRSSLMLKKRFWQNIQFVRVGVWCGANQMIIYFSEASILPSILSSINPFLQIFLVLNMQCGMEFTEFRPPQTTATTFAFSSVCFFFLLVESPVANMYIPYSVIYKPIQKGTKQFAGKKITLSEQS